jgi:hypothetical protein
MWLKKFLFKYNFNNDERNLQIKNYLKQVMIERNYAINLSKINDYIFMYPSKNNCKFIPL